MAEEKNVFGGFEALAGAILETPDKQQEEVPEVDPDEILEKEDEEEEEELTEDEKLERGIEEEEEDSEEEESEEEEESDEEKEVSDEFENLGEYEEPLTKLFQEALYEELGWELEEGESFATIKDLVEYMQGAVTEASVPQYASEELQRLDSFVKQGGKLEDYFENTPGGLIDFDDLDLTNENVQKDVVRELLSTVHGYKEDRIKRTIARYEDGGILEEQAEEASELLKEYKETQQKKLLETQEKYAEDVKQQQQKFYSDVEESIKNLKDIRGIKVSSAERKELLDYIFKPESDGRTKYQKDYASSVQNLIESAFFTKDKDKNTLLTKAKQGAKSDAYKEIHQKIKASKGKRQKSSGGQEGGTSSDTLGVLGRSLIKKV